MNVATSQSNKTIFSITLEDLQYEAMQKLGRELVDEEIDFVKNGLEWGILSSIDILYESVFQGMKESIKVG